MSNTDAYESDGLATEPVTNPTTVEEYQRSLNDNTRRKEQTELERLTEKYGRWTELENQAEAEGHSLGMSADEIGGPEDFNEYEDEVDEGSRITPTLSDPKLWMVQCRYGFERQAVLKVMNKYFATLNKPQKEIHILSAFTTDQNIGYIYVEAFKEIHVSRAVEGIEGLNMWKIKLVKLKDMTSALVVKMTDPTISRGQWVRMKKGIYKDDLAQVWDVQDQGAKIIVKVVPRIDYVHIANPGSGRPFGRYATAPAQKILSLGGDVEQRRDRLFDRTVWMFKGQSYYRGFLLKLVDLDQVQFDVTATREEVAPFRRDLGQDDEGDSEDPEEDALQKVALPLMKRSVDFKREDTIKVTSGPLRNLTGKVITTNVNADGKTIVSMMPDYEGLNEPLEFDADMLKKFFSVGSQVKVLHGTYKGETGLIVKVDEDNDKLIIFSDMTSKEIETLADDVIETTEVSSGRDAFGSYKLHDLVRLSNDRVGVIVQIQTGQFTILDNKGDLQTVHIHEIVAPINNKHTVALDRNSDQIVAEDVVLPVTGQWRGERCTVKHIYRITLFLHNRQCMENAGVFALASRQTVLAGNKTKKRRDHHRTTFRLNGSTIMMANSKRFKDPWIGETVKITRGSWKGYLGIVTHATDKHLKVELHARKKHVNVKRESVKKTDKNGRASGDGSSTTPSPHSGGRTPRLLGGQTPHYHGNATPLHGSQTPMYDGSRTPMYGGMTPRADQTPRYGGETPGYNPPGYGGTTPGYIQTPAYEGLTPKYDGSATPIGGNRTPAAYDMGSNYNDSASTTSYSSHPSRSSYGQTANSPYSANTQGPDTPVAAQQANTPGGTNTYDQHYTNQPMESNFTPNGPHTPQPAYDPSDLSDAQDNKYPSPLANFGDDYQSFSETGEGELSTSDVGVSDPSGRHSDSMTHTDSGNETSGNRNNVPKDPFYFIIPNAELKLNDSVALVKSVNDSKVTVSVDGNDVEVNKDELTYALPKEGDNVKVVIGPVAGEEGELLGIDGDDAIVKMSTTYEIQILARDTMVKIPMQ